MASEFSIYGRVRPDAMAVNADAPSALKAWTRE
jgi:hypothetical protein